MQGYQPILAKAADGMRKVGAFGEPEQWQYDWDQPYSRDEWLELVPTAGGHNRLPPGKLEELVNGLGDAIDRMGGDFVMRYAAVTVTAVGQTRPEQDESAASPPGATKRAPRTSQTVHLVEAGAR